MNEQKSWKPVLTSSVVSLAMLIVWWVGILMLDGAIAERLPYHRYETVALLYPDVYYPGLPGWVLAHVQPFHYGVFVVLFGWLIGLSVVIGITAVKFASMREISPSLTAAGFVVVFFVVVTVLEAVGTVVQ